MDAPLLPVEDAAKGRISRRLVPWAIALLILLAMALILALVAQSPNPQQSEQAKKQAEIKRQTNDATGSAEEIGRLANSQQAQAKAEMERDAANKRYQQLLASVREGASAPAASVPQALPATPAKGPIDDYERTRNTAAEDQEIARNDLVGWTLDKGNDKGNGNVAAQTGPTSTGGWTSPDALAGAGQAQRSREQSMALLRSLHGADQTGGAQQWEERATGARIPSPATPTLALSADTVHQGTAIALATVREINSDIPGALEARVTRDVYDTIDSSHVVIPMGTRLIGPYNSDLIPGQSRLQGGFTRMIFPNGNGIDIAGSQLSDRLGQGGLGGDVDYHLFRSLALQFAVAGVAKLTRIDNGGGGSGGALYGGSSMSSAGQILTNTMQNFNQQFVNLKSTIMVAAGTPFTVTLSRDLILPPAITVDANASSNQETP
ncbi:TrbI/VirB10 family protein [Ralstonia sp.]|uniref:TrbI/VirB10 family protein n=1 Tax=unclassified Ralstonia TaxID=209769 RepID=UPI0031D77511